MAAPTVYLVLSGDADAYQRTAQTAADTLQARLPGIDTVRIDIDALDLQVLQQDDVLISIGTRAAQRLSQRPDGQRLICSLLTEQSYNALAPAAPGQRTAVFIDQPVSRQLALIRTGLPEWSRIAIVHGAESGDFVKVVKASAPALGLTVSAAGVSSKNTLYNALQSVLASPSILLAVPDPNVFNNFTIQNVLLTAYRHRSPVIGFSPAYVRAGAVMAVYSSPEQMGLQAAEIAVHSLRGGVLPDAGHPAYFSVSVNPHVARSLSIELPDAATLEAQIRRMEGSQ